MDSESTSSKSQCTVCIRHQRVTHSGCTYVHTTYTYTHVGTHVPQSGQGWQSRQAVGQSYIQVGSSDGQFTDELRSVERGETGRELLVQEVG